MKKMWLLFVLFFALGINVYASGELLDPNAPKIIIGGTAQEVTNIFKDSNNNIYLKLEYWESGSDYSGNYHVIPSGSGKGTNALEGGGTLEAKHTKFVKLDPAFNKIWEKNYYITGNWNNANNLAPTVTTSVLGFESYADGTGILTGYTFGLSRSDAIGVVNPKDDAFDAFIMRIDKDGNKVYEKSFVNQGLDRASTVKILNDGGYVVRFYYVPTDMGNGNFKQPNEFTVPDKHQVQYVVFNANNEIIDNFSYNQKEKLKEYDFVDESAYDSLTYYNENNIGGMTLVESDHSSKFLGTINEEDYYLRQKVANGVATEWIEITVKDKFQLVKRSMIFVSYEADNPGKEKNKELYQHAFDNGELTNLHTDNSTGVIIPRKNNSDINFANFIINGKKINYDIDTFLENDRTYIELDKLCIMMDCAYVRSEKNNNKLIIDFNIMSTDNNKLINKEDYEYKNLDVSKKIQYTVVHEIGSKSYQTYLSNQPYNIYILKSPIYNEETVDVASIEKDGKIYVPLRFISEALGRYVEYTPGENGGKPTITIGAYGEGDFFDKYGVTMSFDKLSDGDIIYNKFEDSLANPMDLPWGLAKLGYGYGYNKAENKVVSLSYTTFSPIQTTIPQEVVQSSDIPYENKSDTKFKSQYYWRSFYIDGNSIGERVTYKDDNGKEGAKVENTIPATFLLVSNIEGYPFMKLVNVK